MIWNLRTGWSQVGACFFLLGAMAMIASAYSVIAVPLEREFQTSRMVLMLAMTVLSAVCALLSPLLGSLMDRVSLRWLMLLGAGFLAIGYAALSFATSFTQVLVIFGLLMAPANVLLGPMAASVLLSRWFVRRRGMALGIAMTGISMGGIVFPPVIQALLDSYDWRDAFRLLALLLFLCTIPAAALVVNRPADRGLHPDGAESDPLMAAPSENLPGFSARAILMDPSFWLVALLVAVVASGMKGMVTNLAPIALDEGIRSDMAALLISIFAGSGLISKIVFAGLADWLHPRIIMLVMLAGFGVGMACMTQVDAGYLALAIGVSLIGLFGGLNVPLQALLVPRIFGQHIVGRVMGLLNMFILVILLAAPPVFGAIFDRTGSYTAIFIVFTGLAAATMVAVPFIRLHPGAAAAESGRSAPEPA